MSGRADTAANPIRPSAALIRSSAPFGCLRASQCTDSGTTKYTTGISTAVTPAPK